jgi:hypothetical protein
MIDKVNQLFARQLIDLRKDDAGLRVSEAMALLPFAVYSQGNGE